MHTLSDTVDRKFIDSIDLSDWEIETDTGWEEITQIHKTVEYQEWYLQTESGLDLLCADTHIVFDENYNEIFVKDLIGNQSKIITKNGPELVTTLFESSNRSNMYDLTVNSDHHRFFTNNILSHNTTTSIVYLLWTILFKDMQNVAILANKGQTARDILGRLQLAYENLPIWLQQGVVTWNKGFIELENGSKITASSTSSSAARGGSMNLVFLDEFAFVPQNIATEFFTSVYPIITAGTQTKIIIVSTPNGMNLFYKLWADAVNKKSSYVPFETHWSEVPGRDDEWKEETIRNTSQRQFDQEYGALFLGSSNTLISGIKLQGLTYRDPLAIHDNMKIYEYPVKENGDDIKKDHMYAITVDVSEGKNLDFSAFSVFDVSTTPYKQVACYRDPTISPILFPTLIYNAAKLYNDAYVLVEINNNPQVADILHTDLEYENLLKVFTGNKKPQQLSAGFARGIQMGVKMSVAVKRVGCSNLKTLIEGDKLLLNDFETYSELTTFIANKTSFAAEETANDDLVMTCVLFAWMATQKYFKEIVNHDLRKQIQLENLNQVDEESPPVLLVNDGLEHDFEIIGDDMWEKADGSETYSAYFRSLVR